MPYGFFSGMIRAQVWLQSQAFSSAELEAKGRRVVVGAGEGEGRGGGAGGGGGGGGPRGLRSGSCR